MAADPIAADPLQAIFHTVRAEMLRPFNGLMLNKEVEEKLSACRAYTANIVHLQIVLQNETLVLNDAG